MMEVLAELLEVFLELFSIGSSSEKRNGRGGGTRTVRPVQQQRQSTPKPVQMQTASDHLTVQEDHGLEQQSKRDGHSLELQPDSEYSPTDIDHQLKTIEEGKPKEQNRQPGLDPREAMKWSLIFSQPRAKNPYRPPLH